MIWQMALQKIEVPKDASPERLIKFAFQGLEEIQQNSSASFQWKAPLSQVLRRKLPFTVEQAMRLVQLASIPNADFPYRGILSVVESLPMSPPVAEALRRMRGFVDEYYHGGPEARAIHERIDVLVASLDSAEGSCAAVEVTPRGAWSRLVLEEIAGQHDAAGWQAIFVHTGDMKQSEPSKKWIQEAQTHIDHVGRGSFRAAALRWLELGPDPSQVAMPLDGKEAELLKGFVWLLPTFPDSEMAAAVARFAEGCLKKIPMLGAISQKAGNACVNALAAMGTTGAAAQLSRLARRVKYDTSRRLIEKALDEAAKRANISRDELEEMTVPDLDPADDSPRARKERAALLAAHRIRIERLMMTQRAIPLEKWRTCYLNQSLLADLSRRLIWDFETPSGRHLALWREDRMLGDTEKELSLPEGTVVRLWHPIHSDVQTIFHWRCWLEVHGIRQPFKQAHREVYLPTPAERETRSYSNRFSGHIVRQHQFQALCQQRGWKFRLMGEFDSHNTPELELAEWGLRATLDVDFPRTSEVSHHMIYLYIETGRVVFRNRANEPQPLDSIPPALFSEVMRDIDLFAGVASVGNIPEWGQQTSANPFPDYWRAFSFGELGASAESRRDLLERLVPRLPIAGRCRFEGRFLVVRGDRATYKIHLGSGNVLMEPGSRYLCIVQGAAKKGGARSVRLPFDGDETLSLILSKAFLLASDRQIRDVSILTQLPAIASDLKESA